MQQSFKEDKQRTFTPKFLLHGAPFQPLCYKGCLCSFFPVHLLSNSHAPKVQMNEMTKKIGQHRKKLMHRKFGYTVHRRCKDVREQVQRQRNLFCTLYTLYRLGAETIPTPYTAVGNWGAETMHTPDTPYASFQSKIGHRSRR